MKYLLALVFCSILSLSAIAEQNKNIELEQPNDDSLRLLDIYLDKLYFDRVITAYQIKDDLLLPLGAILDIIRIAVKSYPEKGTAEGFIIKENRQFFLDTHRNEVTLNGKTSTYPNNKVLLLPEDIYVEESLLSKWFPFKIEVNSFSAKLIILPTEKLPIIKQLEREQKLKKFKRKKLIQENFPKHPPNYKLASIPFIDQSISLESTRSKDKKTSNSMSYITHASADFLSLESSLYLNGQINSETDHVNNYRITFGRKSPDNDLLGPLNASEFSFGHIFSSNLKHVSRSQVSELGWNVSNFPLTQLREFDTHTFEGELLPEWQVELYHNSVLIDFQATPIEGRYQFVDIPILFGNNFFRLVFYGPLGEEREEIQSFNVNGLLTKPGVQNYQLNVTKDESGSNERSSFQYKFGISKSASAGLDLVSIPVNNIQTDYVQYSLNSFLGNTFLNFNWLHDQQGGVVSDFGLQTKVSEINFKLNYVEFSDFISEVIRLRKDPLHTDTNLRIDSIIHSDLLSRTRFTLIFDEEKKLSGKTKRTYSNRLSFKHSGIIYRNTIAKIIQSNQADRLTGQLDITKSQLGSSFRAGINYFLEPDSKVSSIILNYNSNHLIPNYSFRLGSSFFESGDQNYTIGIGKKHGDFSFNANVSYHTEDSWALLLSSSISLGHNPATSKWNYGARSIADKGAVSVFVYLDDNYNGKFDEGEKGMENIAFNFNGRRRNYKTDQTGYVFIPRMNTKESFNLSVLIDSLEDPAWLPSNKGVRITPRTGHVTQVIFPVINTGEIDGTVYLQTDIGKRPVSDLEVQLLDTTGKVVHKERSEYDGFFVISNIIPGRYQLRVSPEQLQNLGYKQVTMKEVLITKDQLVLNSVDLEVN